MIRIIQSTKLIEAEHGIVCSMPHDFFGYFAWPTVMRQDNGALVVGASGLRNEHVCPFGRSVIFESQDQGRSWSSPRVVNDSPFDDRDVGLLNLGAGCILLSWFTTDIRSSWTLSPHHKKLADPMIQEWNKAVIWMSPERYARWGGSWVRRSPDGGATWENPVRVPVNTPHGPIRLRDGAILYLGKRMEPANVSTGEGGLAAARSDDGGKHWKVLGEVPLIPGTENVHYTEPHAVELSPGKLLGLIRFHSYFEKKISSDLPDYGMAQTRSDDGGCSWSVPEPLGIHGFPPHLLRHSSGALIAVHGYRQQPFGQRAMISHDEGRTWRYDLILRDDGHDSDLGYPSSVELDDGSLLTVYYQKLNSAQEKCSLLWTRWRLPDK